MLSPERRKRNLSDPDSAWSWEALRSSIRLSQARAIRPPPARAFPAARYLPRTGWKTGQKTLWIRLRLERRREWMTEVRERLSWRSSKRAAANQRRNPAPYNLAAIRLIAIRPQIAASHAAQVSRNSAGSRSLWTCRRLRAAASGGVRMRV